MKSRDPKRAAGTERDIQAARPDTAVHLDALRARVVHAMNGPSATNELEGARSTLLSGSRATGTPVLERGAALGRYMVLDPIAEGGMGVVFRGYDPDLRRELALKLVRPGAVTNEEAQIRLLREAQALAKLSHPNVVTVHGAEITEHGVCVAMEFVQGKTLSRWVASTRPSWHEILQVLIAAGEGLAAAHAVGLVHRDVKPSNVIVGDDGRVRVADFGLARASKDPPSEAGVAVESSALGDLTETGTVMGTPAYMAPEQHGGMLAGPAADQYALCLMAWEALWGRRPFAGQNAAELHVAKRRGAPPYPGKPVPRRVYTILARGLASKPGERWSSMPALLMALRKDPSRARRRWLLTGTACLGALGVWGAKETTRRQMMESCTTAGLELEEVWNDSARAGLRQALTIKDVRQPTADTVVPWLDDHARAWQTVRTDICLGRSLDGTWDEDLHARALWCLDERRLEFEALLVQLSRGDRESIDQAVPAVVRLARPEVCGERNWLLRTPRPPTQRRNEVREVRTALSRANAMLLTGAHEAGLEVNAEALDRAQSLGWLPLIADARALRGDLLEHGGAYAQAEDAFEAAYIEAAQAGATNTALHSAEQLVHTVGYRLGRHVEGLRWSRLATIHLLALPDEAGTRRATHLSNLATVHDEMGEYESAKTLNEKALTLREESLGPDHPHVASSLINLAATHASLGHHQKARELMQRAANIRERAFGPEHREVARVLNNLGTIHYRLGSYDEAKSLLERSLALDEANLPPDHPELAQTLVNLAAVHGAIGAYDDGIRLGERGLTITEAALGPDHLMVATVLVNLAQLEAATGMYERAKALQERALTIHEKTLSPEHPVVADSVHMLGVMHAEAGSNIEAKTLLERALAIRERALEPGHPDIASSLNSLALVHQAAGDHDEARQLFEQAFVIWALALGPAHHAVATALHNLAITHMELGAVDEAKEKWERALVISTSNLGEGHPAVADALVGLGSIALRQGRLEEAVELAERAVQLRRREDSSDRAEADFLLARAMWEARGSRERALALAHGAIEAFGAAGSHAKRAEVERWLGRRRPRR